jgi:hypothetical protein
MASKQLNGNIAPDGSWYGTLTDGAGNLVVTSTSSLGKTKVTNTLQTPDGSIYLTLTDGNGNLV